MCPPCCHPEGAAVQHTPSAHAHRFVNVLVRNICTSSPLLKCSQHASKSGGEKHSQCENFVTHAMKKQLRCLLFHHIVSPICFAAVQLKQNLFCIDLATRGSAISTYPAPMMRNICSSSIDIRYSSYVHKYRLKKSAKLRRVHQSSTT